MLLEEYIHNQVLFPKKNNKIEGITKQKIGPIVPFQKYLLINL